MSARRRSLRKDEAGVSEVVGYLFSFTVSFALLVTSLYTFGLVAQRGTALGAEAEFRDISNRVASAILEVFTIGSVLQQTGGDVDSGTPESLRYAKTLDIPLDFRGYRYTIELDNEFIYVNATNGDIRTKATTFKANVVLSPDDNCLAAYVICSVSGSVPSGRNTVTVVYEFTDDPRVNQITIS